MKQYIQRAYWVKGHGRVAEYIDPEVDDRKLTVVHRPRALISGETDIGDHNAIYTETPP